MKNLYHILIYMSLILLISCTKEDRRGSDVPEGMVEVCLKVPEIYNDIDAETKADSEFLKDKVINRLPVGATI